MYSQPQTLRINWPVQALFNFLCDIDTYSQWRNDLKATEWLSADHHVAGASYLEAFHGPEAPARQVYVLAYHPAHLREVAYKQANVEYQVLWQFFAEGSCTVLRYSVKVNCPPLVKWTESFLAERALKELGNDLQRVKELLETDPVGHQMPEKSQKIPDSLNTADTPLS